MAGGGWRAEQGAGPRLRLTIAKDAVAHTPAHVARHTAAGRGQKPATRTGYTQEDRHKSAFMAVLLLHAHRDTDPLCSLPFNLGSSSHVVMRAAAHPFLPVVGQTFF